MAMTKVKIAAAVVLAGLVVVPTAVVVRKWSAPAGPVAPAGMGVVGRFTVSAETTGIVSPLRADGRPDYVAAVNEKYGHGVRPEENAFVGWIEVTGAAPDFLAVRTRDRVTAMCGAKVPAKGMGFVQYASVVKRMGLEGDAVANGADFEAERRVWREDELPTAAAGVKENGAFLDAQAGIWKRPKYWFPAVSDGSGSLIVVLLPSLGKMREAGNALTARALLRVGRGDFEGFVSDVETVQRMARRLASSFGTIEAADGICVGSAGDRGDGGGSGKRAVDAGAVRAAGENDG